MDDELEIEGQAGAPRLEGDDQVAGDQDEAPPPEPEVGTDQEEAPAPGWEPYEVSLRFAGWYTGAMLAEYRRRHGGMPPQQLMGYLVGHPAEFPTVGSTLAPLLDMVAPKGSIAAHVFDAGGCGMEVVIATQRRLPALRTPPPAGQAGPAQDAQAQPAGSTSSSGPAANGAAPAPAPEQNGGRAGFNFTREQWAAIQRSRPVGTDTALEENGLG